MNICLPSAIWSRRNLYKAGLFPSVQTVVLPETPTVPGMDMHALNMCPLQKGEQHLTLRGSLPFYMMNSSCEVVSKSWPISLVVSLKTKHTGNMVCGRDIIT